MARSPACCRGQEARGRLSLTHATTWQTRGSEDSSPALMPSAAGSPVPQSAGLALLCYRWWLIMREIWQPTNPVSTQFPEQVLWDGPPQLLCCLSIGRSQPCRSKAAGSLFPRATGYSREVPVRALYQGYNKARSSLIQINDSLQLTLTSKTYRLNGLLCDTLCHMTASIPRFLLCCCCCSFVCFPFCLFFIFSLKFMLFSGLGLQGQRVNIKGGGDEWD